MVGIALLGAGIFAKEEHLPAILAAPNASLKAVYSRSQASAEALKFTASSSSSNAEEISLYFESPTIEGHSLDDLLSREDISAVVIALPILAQPEIITKSLKAGKHVLSEKPIAGDIASAKELLTVYEEELTPDQKPIWAVAENFRYYPSLDFARDKIKEIGGELATFRLQMYGFIKGDNKYLNTPWRKVPEHQGGFLLDAGVHFAAGLRLLLSASTTTQKEPEEIAQIVSFANLLREHLPPVDTVHGVALTKSGKSGTVSLSFGTEFKSGLEVEVVTTNGSVVWTPRLTSWTTADKDSGEKAEGKKEFVPDSGVKAEVAAFVGSVTAGKADKRQTPREALKDLEVLEGLLQSGGTVIKIGV